MKRLKLALFSMMWCWGVTAAPPTACVEDWQCSKSHFCLKSRGICQPCLRCEDLKREPPTIADKCVKSVVDCGACIKDFVEPQSDHPLECVEPGATSSGLPPLMWTLIALAPIVLIGICVFVCIYLERIPFKLKINSQVHAAVTNGRVQSTGQSEAEGAGDRVTQPAASAPEGPPPYDELELTRVDSPVSDVSPNQHYDNETQPFIRTKSVQQSRQRQTSGTQAANVFNGPHYVRGPQVPRSPEGPAEVPPIGGYDEVTAESRWTANDVAADGNVHPDANANATTSAGATSLAYANTPDTPSSLSVQLAAARNTTLVRPVTVGPPAKVSRRSQGYHRAEQQDSNNNDGESSGVSEGGAAKSGTTTSVPINLLITNMNVVGRSLNIALPRVD